MSRDEFLKGMEILYAFGMPTKEDFQFEYWFQALENEMDFESFKACCIHLCKHNEKFWETDNIPAQIIRIYKDQQSELKIKKNAKRFLEDEEKRKSDIQEAMDSYDSPEDRLKCIEAFKKGNSEIGKDMPK